MKKNNTTMDTTVQPNGMNRTSDTANINDRSKMQNNNSDRMRQNQTVPNNGTMQNPNTTQPNNGTLQNPNNSTATPQVQPVSPVDPARPTR